MFFFKNEEIPSCSSCRYATEYIPHFNFLHDNPFCSKGHGKCKVDKLCGDYKLFGTYFCKECSHYKVVSYDNIERHGKVGYCKWKDIEINANDDACVYFKK